jgi:putative hemolysin
MSIYFEFFLFCVSLFFAALFAFLETAFTALRLFKLKELELSVSRYKSLFASWEANPQRILITILVANNFAHVLTSVLVSHMMQRYLGPLGLAAGVALATVLILIFGEIIPKSFAKAHHERVFGYFIGLINLLYKVTYPFVTILLKIATIFFAKIGGSHVLSKQDDISEKEIEFLIDYSDAKGLMETEKTEMLQNVFSLGQTKVKEIMIPKNEIVSISLMADTNDAIGIFNSSRLSRLPVYEEKEDNITSMIHQKDIFKLLYEKKESQPIKGTIRPVLFVPETKKINQLLSEFLKQHMHMAVIIDEYGNTIGLITLEDILEEIVGDITDEHDKVNNSIVELEKGGWLIAGGTDLEELENLLHIKFDTQISVTIAGFLAEKLQHLPRKGEQFFYEGFCFQIQQASVRRVHQVFVFDNKDNPPKPMESYEPK